MHLDKKNKMKEKKPAVAAPEQRSGWRAVGEAVKASLPATMEGSASQTSGTPYREEWNAARAREKNTRVELRGGKLCFGAAAVEEVSQSEMAINFQPFVGGGVGWQPAGQRPANKQARTPPASPTSSFHSDRTERNKNTFDPASPAEGKSRAAPPRQPRRRKEKVFVRNVQLFSLGQPGCE